MWGQVHKSVGAVDNFGIIPTRVGTRLALRLAVYHCQDHPHACGDKDMMIITELSGLGSSPRVWGQVVFLLPLGCRCGIIPTRVGTSKRKTASSLEKKDHPHACGDKTGSEASAATEMGSSPRVWGQEKDRYQSKCIYRIIPTRVGTRAPTD